MTHPYQILAQAYPGYTQSKYKKVQALSAYGLFICRRLA